MRPGSRRTIACLISLSGASLAAAPGARGAALPENLAPKARIRADSEYSADYVARLVADGAIPEPGSRADPGKGYEIRIDGAAEPVAAGELAMRHGPQAIRLPAPSRAASLEIRFTSSYGGYNPGASEILIFPERTTDGALAKAFRWDPTRRGLAEMPWVDRVDPEKLAARIDSLREAHGDRYPQAADHRARLARIEAETDGEALANLQREVLLFDVDRLLVIRLHEIEASHVYTYHYEGFRAGGGLCIASPHRWDEEPRELEPPEGASGASTTRRSSSPSSTGTASGATTRSMRRRGSISRGGRRTSSTSPTRPSPASGRAPGAGGSGRCGTAVFSGKEDPDRRAILETFEPVAALLAERPRLDMPGGRPAPGLCLDCK